MATTKTKAADKGTNGEKKGEVEFLTPPAGFEDVGTPDIDGWYKPRVGAVFTGQLVGAIKINDEKKPGETRDVLLVKLSAPCDAAVVDQEDGTLDEGQIMAVGVRAKMASLLDYVAHKGTCWVQARGEKKLTKGRSMWEFDVRAKGQKAPPMIQARVSSGDAGMAPGTF